MVEVVDRLLERELVHERRGDLHEDAEGAVGGLHGEQLGCCRGQRSGAALEAGANSVGRHGALDEDGQHVGAGAEPFPAVRRQRYQVQVPDVEVPVQVAEAQVHGEVVVERRGRVVEAEADGDGGVHPRPKVAGAEDEPEEDRDQADWDEVVDEGVDEDADCPEPALLLGFLDIIAVTGEAPATTLILRSAAPAGPPRVMAVKHYVCSFFFHPRREIWIPAKLTDRYSFITPWSESDSGRIIYTTEKLGTFVRQNNLHSLLV